MRSDLAKHPKVCIMADLLMKEDSELAGYVSHFCMCDMAITRNVTRNACVGALVTVWGILRQRGERVDDDLFIEMASLETIDEIADLPGFGSAMKAVGWVKETSKGLILNRFFEDLNTEVDKKRSSAAERQRRYRERKKERESVTKNVTSRVTSRNALEKSRVEKSNTTPIVPDGDVARVTSRSSKAKTVNAIYQEYPKKAGKGAALKSIEKALGKVDFDLLLSKTKEFAAAVGKWPVDRKSFIPNPATWYNQERWDDDPSTWVHRDFSNRPSASASQGDLMSTGRPRFK